MVAGAGAALHLVHDLVQVDALPAVQDGVEVRVAAEAPELGLLLDALAPRSGQRRATAPAPHDGGDGLAVHAQRLGDLRLAQAVHDVAADDQLAKPQGQRGGHVPERAGGLRALQ